MSVNETSYYTLISNSKLGKVFSTEVNKREKAKKRKRVGVILNFYLCIFDIYSQVPHNKGRHSIVLSLPAYSRLLHNHLAVSICLKKNYNYETRFVIVKPI